MGKRRIKHWFDACISFLSFLAFVALAIGVLYYSLNLLQPTH